MHISLLHRKIWRFLQLPSLMADSAYKFTVVIKDTDKKIIHNTEYSLDKFNSLFPQIYHQLK